jgi:putative ABC transport system substrate-binding protein
VRSAVLQWRHGQVLQSCDAIQVTTSDACLRRDEAMDKTTTMRRLLRALLTLSTVAGLWLPQGSSAADPSPRVARVGFLSLDPPDPEIDGRITPELAKLGHVEGRNLAIEVRHAAGDPARLDRAAAELVQRKVDVIYAVTNAVAFAARNATRTIPIVVWAAHGAVETGLVSQLRRPGKNITGTESLAIELDAKRIQLLKQIAPGLKRMAVAYDGTDQGSPHHLNFIQSAGKQLGVVSTRLELRQLKDFEPVFSAAVRQPPDGLFLLTSNLTYMLHPRVFEFALSHHLPTMCEFKPLAQAGCLMSYGPTFDEITERCAAQIDKILRGTPPGELPVEQPTRFELVINLKTAKALGISVPQELLLRADEVIE